MKLEDFKKISSQKLESLTLEQLKSVYATGACFANRRIGQLNKKGYKTPAYSNLPGRVKQAGGYKYPQKITKQKLISQIQSQQQFVKARTSTVSGYEYTIKKASTRLTSSKARFGYNKEGQLVQLKKGQKSAFTEKQLSKYWDLYHKISERDENMKRIDSKRIKAFIYDLVTENHHKSINTLELELETWANAEYERLKAEDENRIADIYRGFI